MLICGPSLSLFGGCSAPFVRVGSERIWHTNCSNYLTSRRSITCKYEGESIKSFSLGRVCRSYSLALTTFLTAAAVMVSTATADTTYEPEETLSNIPQTLSGECRSPQGCKKAKIQKPKSRKAESCTIKCVTTCIRGGEGEGPLNLRRPLVVFKQGFRTRQYCLVECSDICNLISDADDVP